MAAKFPCCPGTVDSFEVSITPVVIQCGIYIRHRNRYDIGPMQPKATIPDKVFREGLFSDNPEINLMIEKYGTAVCPRCGKTHPLSKITVVDSCHRCGNGENIKYCKYREIFLCKACSKNYPKCECKIEDCYTGVAKRSKED